MNLKVDKDSWLVSLGVLFVWVATSALAVFDGFHVRETIIDILRVIQAEQYKVFRQNGGIGQDFQTGYLVEFIANGLLLVIGVILVTVVIWIEYYLRRGRSQGQLLRRIGKVIGVEVAVLVISILIRVILPA